MTGSEGELLEKVRERRNAALENSLREIGPQPARWLALLPEWTDSLAVSCEFPPGEDDLGTFLRRAQEQGFLEEAWERDIDGTEEHRFWMPSPVRSALMEYWSLDKDLRLEAKEVAEKILEVDRDRPETVSVGLRRWAQLARGELGGGAVTGSRLMDAVDASLIEDDPGGAGNWITAGEALGEPLGAEMDTAAERAQRRVSFYYRGQQDAHYLRNFVTRDEQMEALQQLLGSDEHWALHFIGPSGVGKTMLMRYLTSRSRHVRPIASPARIDFDYIDPRYPLESPARLLHELGEELAVDLADGTQESMLRSFREAVTGAESGRVDPGNDPMHALRSEAFDEVVQTFAAFVNELPQPVVLILDTCEELAKLHPPGEDVPSISATFEILERVHQAAPGVRVIFAGRRWLTPKAANAARGKATPASVMCMKPRPYLLMHEVRGFTAAEVGKYLTKVCGRHPSPAILDAVREATVDPARAPGFGEGEASGDGSVGHRYNPNDVWLLGGWLADAPGLSPERLAGGNLDQFVEARILGRLGESQALRDAIPAAIALERFDATMIAPALPADHHGRLAVLNGLIEQEWTHLEGGPDPEEIRIRIDPGLLLRLNNYYDRSEERRRLVDDARSSLGPHLGRLMEQAPGGASIDAIDAAMRLLPAEEAVRRFDRLASRVAEPDSWAWAESVCSRLLSPERTPPLDDRLVASVGALYVAALAHRGSTVNLAPFWEQVVEKSSAHPEPTQAAALHVRGTLGGLATAAANGHFDEAWAAEALAAARALVGQGSVMPIAPALLAAVEALVDANEENHCAIPLDVTADCLRVLLEHFASEEAIQAHILALAGRLHAAVGDWQMADRFFERLEQMPLDGESAERHSFVDWVAPSSLRHRALLELLRYRLVDGSEGERLLRRCQQAALSSLDGADAAQLLSLAVKARLARGDRLEVESILVSARAYEREIEGYDLVCPAHRVAPPLFVSLADAALALGDGTQALRLLAERERLAISRRMDEDAARAAALATVHVLKRLRRRERLALISGKGDDEEMRMEKLAAGALIGGLQPPIGRGAEGDHAAWRARILLDPESRELAALLMRTDRAEDPVTAIHESLDRIELMLLLPQRRRRALARRVIRQETALVNKNWGKGVVATMADPLGAVGLRLRLRRFALIPTPEESRAWIPANRRRLVGELALEEGELLALRLPERALPLLSLARQQLEGVGDLHSAFTAALLEAIAAVHSGWDEDARSRCDDVLRLYRAAARVDEFLPADPLGPLEGTGTVWEAWLLRLRSYLEWCDDGPPQTLEAGALQLEPEHTLVEASRPAPRSSEGGRRERGEKLDYEELDLEINEARYRHNRGQQFEVSVESRPFGLGTRLLNRLRRTLNVTFPGLLPVLTFSLFEGPISPGSPSRLARHLGSRIEQPKLRVRLTVSPGLAPIDWERRLIGHMVSPAIWKPESLPEIWRVPLRAAGATPAPWSPSIVPVCSPRWQPLVVSGVGDTAELLPFAPGAWREAGAAVALGLPVVTQAGWRLRLDDDSLATPLDDPGAPRAQELVSPDLLAAIAPVILLLGRPGGPRLAPDPRTAEGLRGFANEAFLAGAHAVITVPVLPPEPAGEAIALAAEQIVAWDEAPSVEQLRELAAGLREVAANLDAQPALDVCLFARR